VFAPERVDWMYAAPAAWTLKAMLSLEPLGSPCAPRGLVTAPPGCGIPPEQRGTWTVRPT
jgi:hypothetical protein